MVNRKKREKQKKPSKLDKKRAAEPVERPHGRYGRREKIQKIDDLKRAFWKKLIWGNNRKECDLQGLFCQKIK